MKTVFVAQWDNGQPYEDRSHGIVAVCTTQNKAEVAAKTYLTDRIADGRLWTEEYYADVFEVELNTPIYDERTNLFAGKFITRFKVKKIPADSRPLLIVVEAK